MVEQDVNRSFIGRFQLLLEMNRGGMAKLFLGRLSGPGQFQKLFVIKQIHDHLAQDRQFVEMLMDEARIAALIHHPNVGTVFELGEDSGVPFIVMEYIHGHNLAEVMVAAKKLLGVMDWRHAARIASDTASGLHAAHELKTTDSRCMNVVHRDVSPQNILVDYDGHVKIVDFGIAFAVGKLVKTAIGTRKGKIAYMSPEQAKGEPLDCRSDLFSLGIVLWECLTLTRLFKGKDDSETIRRLLVEAITPPVQKRPDVPMELSDIAMRALARDREERFTSCRAFQSALEGVLERSSSAVGTLQLGKLMARLFSSQKQQKDEQVQKALALPAGRDPLLGRGMITEISIDDHADAAVDREELIETRVGQGAPSPPSPSGAPSTPPPPSFLSPAPQPTSETATVVRDGQSAQGAVPTGGRRMSTGAWIGVGTAAGAVLLLGVWLGFYHLARTKEGRKIGKSSKAEEKGRPAPDSRAEDARKSSASARPAPAMRPLDISNMSKICRRAHECITDRFILSKGAEIELVSMSFAIITVSGANKAVAEKQCIERLDTMKRMAEKAPGRWPEKCGGTVKVELPEKLTTLGLCNRVYKCCLELSPDGSSCRNNLLKLVSSYGTIICIDHWYRYHKVLKAYDEIKKRRPGACPQKSTD